jgi:hypothetical protein
MVKILWHYILPTNTCMTIRFNVKNTICCLSDNNTPLTQKSLTMIVHVISHTLHITVLYLHMSWNMIARIILDTTFISLYKHHLLVRNYSLCKQDIYLNEKLLIPLWMNGNPISTYLETQHRSETSLYILLHPKLWVEIRDLSSQIPSTSLSVMLQTLLLVQREQIWDGVYYLTKHVNLKCWVKMVDSFVYEFPKWYLLALILHIMTHFLHITAYFSENVYSSIETTFLWLYIPDSNSKLFS